MSSFAMLEKIVAEKPSWDAWNKLCSFFRWRVSRKSLSGSLAIAEKALQHWDDRFRSLELQPSRKMNPFAKPPLFFKVPNYWPLVRSVTIKLQKSALFDWTDMDCSRIRHLSLFGGKEGCDYSFLDKFKKLNIVEFSASNLDSLQRLKHTKKLTELTLDRCEMWNLNFLFDASNLQKLTYLSKYDCGREHTVNIRAIAFLKKLEKMVLICEFTGHYGGRNLPFPPDSISSFEVEHLCRVSKEKVVADTKRYQQKIRNFYEK